MTIAVCMFCGEEKFGAFAPCDACKRAPASEDELAVSLAISSHHYSIAEMKELSEIIKATGAVPMLPAEVQQQFVETVRWLGPNLFPMTNMKKDALSPNLGHGVQDQPAKILGRSRKLRSFLDDDDTPAKS